MTDATPKEAKAAQQEVVRAEKELAQAAQHATQAVEKAREAGVQIQSSTDPAVLSANAGFQQYLELSEKAPVVVSEVGGFTQWVATGKVLGDSERVISALTTLRPGRYEPLILTDPTHVGVRILE